MSLSDHRLTASTVSWAVGVLATASVNLYFLAPYWAQSPWQVVANGAAATVFALTGWLLSSDPTQNGNARLCLATAVSWTSTHFITRAFGPFPLIGFLAEPVLYACLATLLLRYPDARLRHKRQTRLITAVWLWCTLGPCVWALLTTAGDHHYLGATVWWVTLHSGTPSNYVLGSVYRGGAVALIMLFVREWRRKLAEARSLDRALLAPVFLSSLSTALALVVEILVRLASATTWYGPVIAVEALISATVPVSFFVAALQRRLSRAVVADLVPRLVRPISPERLEQLLRRSLRDPTLRLWFWLPQHDHYVDVQGRVATPTGAGHRRDPLANDSAGDGAGCRDGGNDSGSGSGAIEVAAPVAPAGAGRVSRTIRASDGDVIGLVELDEALGKHSALVDSVVSAATISLENGRLQAQVRAQLREVAASRHRILEAGDSERRRIERDLHDGLQQTLVAAKLRLASATLATAEDLHGPLAEVRALLQDAIEELRVISRGIDPPLLATFGLRAALAERAGQFPLPITVEAPDRRWPISLERTAYYIVREALSNMAKHSHATRARVRVAGTAEHLLIEVIDNGCGHPGSGGAGITGLRDRAHAHGGTLEVSATPDGGTLLRATLPIVALDTDLEPGSGPLDKPGTALE